MIVTDLAILAIVAYATYLGSRRSAVLVVLELASFFVATTLALLVYHWVALALVGFSGITPPLANIGAFALVWIIFSIGLGLLIRLVILPRLQDRTPQSWASQVGAASLNAIKALVLVTVGLILFAGLPFSATAKE